MSVWRVLAWAAAVAAIRHMIVPRPSLPRRLAGGLVAAIRTPDPIYEDAIGGGIAARLAISRRRAVLALGVLIVVFAGLTVVMTYPQVRVLNRGVSLDTADPLLSTWRLEWIAHQLPRDPLHLFDANIFHPEPDTLAYSDAMLVPALTVAPLVWLGVPPLLAYNLLLLSGFVFSGAAMVLLVWSLTRHVAASLLAGFVFAFLPFRFVHYAHLELLMTQWMPLCLWALHRTITYRPSAGWAADWRVPRGADAVLLVLRHFSGDLYGAGGRGAAGGQQPRAGASGHAPARRRRPPRRRSHRAADAALLPCATGCRGATDLGDRVLQRHAAQLPCRAPAQRVVRIRHGGLGRAGARALSRRRRSPDRPRRVVASSLARPPRLRGRAGARLRHLARIQRQRLSVAPRARFPVSRAARAGAHGHARRPVAGDPRRLRCGQDPVAPPQLARRRRHLRGSGRPRLLRGTVTAGAEERVDQRTGRLRSHPSRVRCRGQPAARRIRRGDRAVLRGTSRPSTGTSS